MNKYRITRMDCGTIRNYVYEAMDMNGLMQMCQWSDPGDIIKMELIGTTDADVDHTSNEEAPAQH